MTTTLDEVTAAIAAMDAACERLEKSEGGSFADRQSSDLFYSAERYAHRKATEYCRALAITPQRGVSEDVQAAIERVSSECIISGVGFITMTCALSDWIIVRNALAPHGAAQPQSADAKGFLGESSANIRATLVDSVRGILRCDESAALAMTPQRGVRVADLVAKWRESASLASQAADESDGRVQAGCLVLVDALTSCADELAALAPQGDKP